MSRSEAQRRACSPDDVVGSVLVGVWSTYGKPEPMFALSPAAPRGPSPGRPHR